MKKFIIIETTYSNMNNAKKMAKILIKKNLAACIKFKTIESIFKWKNQIEEEKEILVSITTNQSCYEEIEKIISKNHEYETPQILCFEVKKGLKRYLEWIDSCL